MDFSVRIVYQGVIINGGRSRNRKKKVDISSEERFSKIVCREGGCPCERVGDQCEISGQTDASNSRNRPRYFWLRLTQPCLSAKNPNM